MSSSGFETLDRAKGVFAGQFTKRGYSGEAQIRSPARYRASRPLNWYCGATETLGRGAIILRSDRVRNAIGTPRKLRLSVW
jgi:hypothetical protein